jgi:hypothetical protein
VLNTKQVHVLPFGRHRDRPLSEVPSDYLQWAIRECKLSSGVRTAVTDELRRRNVETPAPAPPRPLIRCPDHRHAELLLFWMQDSLGRVRIRAECSVCRRSTDHPPCVSPYTELADANASQTPILDALTRLEDLGVQLQSDGRTVAIPWQDWRRVPPDLHAIVRQCRHQLARLLGDTRRRGA